MAFFLNTNEGNLFGKKKGVPLVYSKLIMLKLLDIMHVLCENLT